MKPYLPVLFAITAALSACKSDHQTVVKEQREAQKEIQSAEEDKARTAQKDADRVADAQRSGDPDDVARAKLKESKNLAEANREIADEKVEATKEITEAKKDAGESTGTLRTE